ncbi:MAG: response regulator [Bradymonadaceae bacterium]|nr:response regulator [Lujinxingiaceae bacterium]
MNDTGLGMSPETVATLFQPFMQADVSLDHSAGGLGLGLALVKDFVELHGGGVSAKSAGIGQGAQFEIQLPLKENIAPAAASAPGKAVLAPRKVLIIEDNLDVASMLQMVLELKGHEVAVAHDGPSGIAMARGFKPHIVLCDIGLPGMDGYEVAQSLRSDPELKALFLVALSGYAMPADLEKSLNAGFERHIAKPIKLELLEELIEQAPLKHRSGL